MRRTQGRWIVDATGTRVKLACVNWAGAEVKVSGVPTAHLWGQRLPSVTAMQDGIVGGLQARNVTSASVLFSDKMQAGRSRSRQDHAGCSATIIFLSTAKVLQPPSSQWVSTASASRGLFGWPGAWKCCAHGSRCSLDVQVQTNPQVPDDLQESLLAANPQLMGLRTLDVLDAAALLAHGTKLWVAAVFSMC